MGLLHFLLPALAWNAGTAYCDCCMRELNDTEHEAFRKVRPAPVCVHRDHDRFLRWHKTVPLWQHLEAKLPGMQGKVQMAEAQLAQMEDILCVLSLSLSL